MKKILFLSGLLATVVGMPLASATGIMLVDRGLPTANLNNAVGAVSSAD